jgi:antitoxin CcdA
MPIVKRRNRKPAVQKRPARVASPNAERAPLNLTLRKAIVARARTLDLNISEIADAALEAAVKKAEHEVWLAENKEAFDYYNKWVEKHGVFGLEWRQF